MTDAEKEQIKLRANALDRTSTACVTVGILAPLAASLYTNAAAATDWKLFVGSVFYFGTALGLHHLARWVLEELDQ